MTEMHMATLAGLVSAMASLGMLGIASPDAMAQSFDERGTIMDAVQACQSPDFPPRERVKGCDVVLKLDDLDGDRRASLLAYRANGRFELFDFTGAVEDVSEALELTPNDFSLFQSRARALGMMGEHEAALIDLDEALALAPHVTQLLVDRAIAHAEMENVSAALRDLDAAEEADPTYADIYNIRAGIFVYQQDLDKAEEQFTKAIDLSPEFGLLYSRRGFARLLDDRIADALADFDIAVGMGVAQPETFMYRGIAQDALNDTEEALADFSRAIDLDPSMASAWYQRGVIHMMENTYSKALEDLDVAAQLSPSADYLNALAWVYVSATDKRYRDAARGLELVNDSLAFEENADNTDTAAAAYVLLGKPQEALSYYLKAMDLGGEERVILYQEYLAETGHYRGDVDGMNGPEIIAAILAFSKDGRVLLVD